MKKKSFTENVNPANKVCVFVWEREYKHLYEDTGIINPSNKYL